MKLGCSEVRHNNKHRVRTICMENPEIPGEFKWNGSSWWKLSGKKVIPFEVSPFPRFYQNVLYHLLDY